MTDPIDIPGTDDVPDDLPVLPPEGEVPPDGVTPTDQDWEDGADDVVLDEKEN